MSLAPLEARRLEADRAWLARTLRQPVLTAAEEAARGLAVEEAPELAARELRRAHPAW